MDVGQPTSFAGLSNGQTQSGGLRGRTGSTGRTHTRSTDSPLAGDSLVEWEIDGLRQGPYSE